MHYIMCTHAYPVECSHCQCPQYDRSPYRSSAPTERTLAKLKLYNNNNNNNKDGLNNIIQDSLRENNGKIKLKTMLYFFANFF